MDEAVFGVFQERAEHLTFSSMNYLDFEDCVNAAVLCDSDGFILLHDTSKTPAMLYFAADDFGRVVDAIAGLPGGLRLHFVPRAYAERLTALGFMEWCEWADYWNIDLAGTAARLPAALPFDFLRPAEYADAAALSQRCRLQSRGFEGETAEWFAEWDTDNAILTHRDGEALAGFCCVSIYNEGTTLWVREIAVDPPHQGKGIGKALLAQAIQYGIEHGAVKAFLAADVLNHAAIGLYEKFGFRAKGGEGELQMVRERTNA